MYKKPSDIKYGAVTYANALSNEDMTAERLADLFEPQLKITGIDYNYIVGIDQNNSQSRQHENETIYENGDVFGSFSLAKNMYNATYSMDYSTFNSPKNILETCREYCGI